jgi:hypothetical protein
MTPVIFSRKVEADGGNEASAPNLSLHVSLSPHRHTYHPIFPSSSSIFGMPRRPSVGAMPSSTSHVRTSSGETYNQVKQLIPWTFFLLFFLLSEAFF